MGQHLWTALALLILLFGITSSNDVIDATQMGNDLKRPVQSSQILDKDQNGNCYYPGLCTIDYNKCNIKRVRYSSIESTEQLINDHLSSGKPLIIQICDDYPLTISNKIYKNQLHIQQQIKLQQWKSDCSQKLQSLIINNDTGIWEWNKLISTVRPSDYQNIYLPLETNGSYLQRSETCDIHSLKENGPRYHSVYKSIAESIFNIPSFLDELDIFNELIGFLHSSDESLLGNKWVIFGNTGSGASFHYDYYHTSFWNMPIQGQKYWYLIDWQIVENILFKDDKQSLHNVINMPLWQWWINIYPFINDVIESAIQQQQVNRKNSNEKFPENSDLQPPYSFECMQNMGDMLYAPSKWYHSTINLQATLSISRNMIEESNYIGIFEFLTSLQTLHSVDDDMKPIGLKHAMDLCCALYKYNQTMFENTYCWTKTFLQRINSFEIYSENDKLKNEWIYGQGIGKDLTNSKLYIHACNYAKKHATFSSFRA